MPALTPDDVRATVALLGRPGLDGRDRFAENPVLDGLTVAIEALELVGEEIGLADVVREHEVQRDIGAPEAPCGVDPRREPERDCGRVDRRRIDAGDAHQRREPGLLRAGEAAEARRRECAILVDERHDVGDRRERDQVGVAGERRVLGAEESLRELCDDTGAAEIGKRVLGGPRGHDRAIAAASRRAGDGR